MKTLNFNNEQFQAEKIIKTEKDIIGCDINDNEIFSFKGISDFTGFILKDENDIVIEFEAPPMTDAERISMMEFTMMGLMDMLLPPM